MGERHKVMSLRQCFFKSYDKKESFSKIGGRGVIFVLEDHEDFSGRKYPRELPYMNCDDERAVTKTHGPAARGDHSNESVILAIASICDTLLLAP